MKQLSKEEMKNVIGGVVQSQCFECSSEIDPTVGTFYCSSGPDCISKTQQTCAGDPTNCECHPA